MNERMPGGKDLTVFVTMAELRAEAERTRRPFEELRKIQQQQIRWKGSAPRRREAEVRRNQKAAAAEKAKLNKAERRGRAQAETPKFVGPREQLPGLGPTPAIPEIGTRAVDGPWVAAQLGLNEVWYRDQLAGLRAQLTERLRPVADHLGWDLEYLVTRVMAGEIAAVHQEAAHSQGNAYLVVKGAADDWADASAQQAKGAFGHESKAPNRYRSRRKS